MAGVDTTIRYFSWVRERVGKGEEQVVLPDTIVTVMDLLMWLKQRDEGFGAALEFPEIFRVALDQEHVDHTENVGTPREIAIFPPMTGG